MIKLKQITVMAMIGAACWCSTQVMAAACVSTKRGSSVSIATIQKQYKNCKNCGTQKDKKGKKVYYCYCEDKNCQSTSTPTNTTKSCSANQWKNGATCTACPENATCNGTTFTCKSGYTKSGNSCVKPSASGSTTQAKVASCDSIKRGSSVSIETIKKQYKNCKNCGTKKDKKGKKVYYCYCEDKNCQSTSTPTNTTKISQTTQNNCSANQWKNGVTCTACPENATCNGTTFTCKSGYAKNGNSCAKPKPSAPVASTTQAKTASCDSTKRGSSVSIETIKKQYKNCKNCGTQKDSKGKKVYYCYCQDKNCSTSSTTTNSSSNAKSKYIKCKSNEVHTEANEGFRESDCMPCPAHATCDGTEKVKCDQGYSVTSTTFMTTIYPEGRRTVFMGGYNSCAKTCQIKNAKRCFVMDSGWVDVSCKDGYYKTGSVYEAKCAKCPDHVTDCIESGGAPWVLNCEKGYGITKDRRSCEKCPKNNTKLYCFGA